MSAVLPDSIDAWRAVGARRIYEGSVPLSRFSRLRDSLTDTDGECRYRIELGRDELGAALVWLQASAELPLECQRSLERFLFPVNVRQQLGLVRNDADEAALAPDVEPVLVPPDGNLSPLELIEDELILALPVVPVREAAIADGGAIEAKSEAAQPEEIRVNPFAALAVLKPKSK